MTVPLRPRFHSRRACAATATACPSRASRALLAGLALVAVAAVPAAGLAQGRPDSSARDTVRAGRDSTARIEGVVIRGRRAPTVVGGASAIVAPLDSLRLPVAPVLDDALRALPFVLVRRNSRGEMEISTRGSDSRQTAVLVDGVPLTLGWDHRSDPSLVPLTGAGSITLVRGLSSILMGPNVLGGVIDVGAAGGAGGAAARPSLTMGSEVDQFGGHALSINGSTPFRMGSGSWSARGGAGFRDSPGFARSRDVVNLTGDPDLRTNSDVRQVDLFGSLRWQGQGGRFVGFSASGYDTERGVPPELHVAEPRLWRYPEQRRALAVLSGGSGPVATPFGHGSLQASLGVNSGSTTIESFATHGYAEVVGTEEGDERTLTGRLLAEHSLPAGATLRAALTGADVRYDERLDDAPVSEYRQRLWSAGAEAMLPVGAATRLSGGLVLDGADTPETGGKPSLGGLSAWGGRLGVSGLVGGGAVRLHASASRRARFPALRELYSGSLGRFEPNPGLRPERLTGLEAGATTSRGAVQLQGTVFHHRLADAVVRTSTAEGQFRRVNRDEIRSTGVELLGEWRVSAGTSLQGDLTLQHVRLHDQTADGAGRRAEHQPELRASTRLATPFVLGSSAFAAARYVGAQYCVHPDLSRDVRLGAELSGDLGVERSWSLGRAAGLLFQMLRTTLTMDNVTDAAVYDQCGLPQAGRMVRLRVEVR